MRATPILFAFPMLFVLAGQAPAQKPFIDGVYARSAELCAKAKSKGLDSVFDEGEAVLTSRGIDGIEYNCEFLEVLGRAHTPGWRVSALCEVPDHAFPDTISVMPRGEGELELTAASDMGSEDDKSGNSGIWFRCDGVALP